MIPAGYKRRKLRPGGPENSKVADLLTLIYFSRAPGSYNSVKKCLTLLTLPGLYCQSLTKLAQIHPGGGPKLIVLTLLYSSRLIWSHHFMKWVGNIYFLPKTPSNCFRVLLTHNFPLLSIGPVHFRFKGCLVDFFIFLFKS